MTVLFLKSASRHRCYISSEMQYSFLMTLKHRPNKTFSDTLHNEKHPLSGFKKHNKNI